MLKLTNLLHAGAAAQQLQELCAEPRGTLQRPICAGDLVEFGLCPNRWVQTTDPDDPFVAYGPPPAEWLAWAESIGRKYFVGRPATYDALVLKCPNCGSAGPAKSCKKCGVRRKNTVVPRPWTSAAHHCLKWEMEHQDKGVRTMAARAWEAAQAGADRLAKDAPAHALMADSDCSVMALGTWTHPRVPISVPVWAWLSLLPKPGGEFGHCVARVAETSDADPRAWERTVVSRGLHIEAALATGLLNSDPENTRREYLWLVLEKPPPRLLARRRISKEALIEGATRLEQLLEAYAIAVAHAAFPSFEPGTGNLATVWQTADIADWLTAGSGPDGGYLAPALLEGARYTLPAHAPSN